MKIKAGDREVEAELVDVVSESETANEYVLANGTVLRMKTPVTSIVRIVGETDTDGNPAYWVRHQTIVSVAKMPR